MTLIGPGTWDAARAAADVALTAADLVLARRTDRLCLTAGHPGHHATRSAFGGSCYLNNAAIAASRLATSDQIDGPVAVIDIDAHHGNGTQSIFYEDPNILTGSVHVDPAEGWFPHLLGFASESGQGAGAGANRNIPLPPGSNDEIWLHAIAELCEWAQSHNAAALVIPLGVDAAKADPESPLGISAEAFARAGRLLGALDLPTVVVQEGGYNLDTLAPLVLETLSGLIQR